MTDALTPQRRKLRLRTIDEAIGEAERVAEAERQGRLARAGNWSLGKTLGHLATWANFAHDGYPAEVHPPLPIRLVIRLMRGRILRDGMSPGMRIGRMPEGTLGLDELPTEEGLNRYRAALKRLAASAPTGASPVFGRLTHDQWIQLNLRHAELHLGFQVPTGT
jgi:hypothetical protein